MSRMRQINAWAARGCIPSYKTLEVQGMNRSIGLSILWGTHCHETTGQHFRGFIYSGHLFDAYIYIHTCISEYVIKYIYRYIYCSCSTRIHTYNVHMCMQEIGYIPCRYFQGAVVLQLGTTVHGCRSRCLGAGSCEVHTQLCSETRMSCSLLAES